MSRSPEGISRRELFSKSVEGAANISLISLILNGCHSSRRAGPEVFLGEAEKKRETLSDEQLAQQWNALIQGVIESLSDNPDIPEEEVVEWKNVLQSFNITKYFSELSRIGSLPNDAIKGNVSSITIQNPTPGQSRWAEVEERDRMKIFRNDRLRSNGAINKKNVHHILRHEIGHIISFNHLGPNERAIPWVADLVEHGKNEGQSASFYEGSTEVQARLTGEKTTDKDGDDTELGYREGATFAANIVKNVVGEEIFVRAFVLKDFALLAEAFKKKTGKNLYDIFVNWDFLKIGVVTLFQLSKLGDATIDKGLSSNSCFGERTHVVKENDSHMLFHISNSADIDDPPKYALQGVGEWDVKIKPTTQLLTHGYANTTYDRKVKVVFRDENKSKPFLNTQGFGYADTYTNVPVLTVFKDDSIEKYLTAMNGVNTESPQFRQAWSEIQKYVGNYVQTAVKTTIKKGVDGGGFEIIE